MMRLPRAEIATESEQMRSHASIVSGLAWSTSVAIERTLAERQRLCEGMLTSNSGPIWNLVRLGVTAASIGGGGRAPIMRRKTHQSRAFCCDLARYRLSSSPATFMLECVQGSAAWGEGALSCSDRRSQMFSRFKRMRSPVCVTSV